MISILFLYLPLWIYPSDAFDRLLPARPHSTVEVSPLDAGLFLSVLSLMFHNLTTSVDDPTIKVSSNAFLSFNAFPSSLLSL
jgi:hypothetical protein